MLKSRKNPVSIAIIALEETTSHPRAAHGTTTRKNRPDPFRNLAIIASSAGKELIFTSSPPGLAGVFESSRRGGS